MTDTATMVALGEDYPEMREAVRRICGVTPGHIGASSRRRRPIRPSSSTN